MKKAMKLRELKSMDAPVHGPPAAELGVNDGVRYPTGGF
jgi:hypothetical protein